MRVDRIDSFICSRLIFPPFLCHNYFSLHGWQTLFQIDYLHDDVFLLLRPEFISFFLLFLNLVVLVKFK